MYACFCENIFMAFLPAHSSHVLQPLDLGVFSSLKKAYRRHLGDLAILTDSSPVGKLNFLRCYIKARLDALTEKNIKAGFRATGIYPRNKVRALSSRQVVAPARRATPEPAQGQVVGLQTPKGRRDAQKLLDATGIKSPGTRLAFRKIAKALEEKDMQLAMANERIRKLTAENEQLRASKRRRKVPENPNNRFLTIAEIVAARAKAVVVEPVLEGGEAAEGTELEEEGELAPNPRRSSRNRVPSKRALEAENGDNEF